MTDITALFVEHRAALKALAIALALYCTFAGLVSWGLVLRTRADHSRDDAADLGGSVRVLHIDRNAA